MSDIINGNNIDDKKEDQNDIKSWYFHNIFESGLAEPKGEIPAFIQSVYNFDRRFMGKGQTITIVSAFNYPTALNDFNVFSK